MKVLLVEDYPTTCDSIATVLRDAGHAVDQAPNAKDASARIISGGYDLAVIDYILGDGDGLMLVSEMRGRGDLLPVLMISAVGGDMLETLTARAVSKGAVVLPKPFEAETLLALAEGMCRPATCGGSGAAVE